MPFRRLTETEVVERFVEDPEVVEATRMWAKGQLSDRELIDRLVYIQTFIDSTAEEYEREPVEVA
jgi:hypothetical protein